MASSSVDVPSRDRADRAAPSVAFEARSASLRSSLRRQITAPATPAIATGKSLYMACSPIDSLLTGIVAGLTTSGPTQIGWCPVLFGGSRRLAVESEIEDRRAVGFDTGSFQVGEDGPDRSCSSELLQR